MSTLKEIPLPLPRPSLHQLNEGIEEVTFVPESAPTLKAYLKAFAAKPTGLAAPIAENTR